jgi:WD40 repeat protein
MAQELSYNNENIIKSIFNNIGLSNNQRLLDKITNKIICKIILSISNYKDMFKSIGKNKIILEGNENWIRSAIVFSENLIILCSFDSKTLRVWNIDNLKCSATIKEETYIGSLLKLPDGNLAIGCITKINIRNVIDGLKCIRTITFSDYTQYRNLKLLTNSRLVFTAYRSEHTHSLLISNLDTNNSLIRVIDETEKFIYPIATWSNTMTSSSYFDSAIKIWSFNDDDDINLKGKLTGHSKRLLALMFAKSNLLLSGSHDYTIRVWDIVNKQCFKIIQHHRNAVILTLLPNGYFAARSCEEIKIYDLNSYNCVNTLVGHKYDVFCILFIKGNRILTGSKPLLFGVINLIFNYFIVQIL